MASAVSRSRSSDHCCPRRRLAIAAREPTPLGPSSAQRRPHLRQERRQLARPLIISPRSGDELRLDHTRSGSNSNGGTKSFPPKLTAESARLSRKVEAAGIEPASAAAPDRASTGLAHPLLSPGRPVCERPTAGPAILWSHPSGDWLSFGASPFMTPLPEPRAESGATRRLTQLSGECEFVIRTYVGSRLFYEADRGPRPAAQPENRPRRNLVAPVCS